MAIRTKRRKPSRALRKKIVHHRGTEDTKGKKGLLYKRREHGGKEGLIGSACRRWF